MKFILGLLASLVLVNACGSPPTRPESLWNSFPPSAPSEEGISEGGTAKRTPARVLEGDEGGGEEGGEEGSEVGAGPGEVAGPSEPDSSTTESGEPGAEGPGEAEQEEEGIEAPRIVVLNEIYYDAVGSDTDGILFVELYGTPGMEIGGFRINFVDGGDGSIDDSITLPEGARVGGGGFYLIADSKTGSPAESNVTGADLIDNFDPQNGPDAVQLLDEQGQLLDAVGYGEGGVPTAENGLAALEGTPAPDVVNGHSLERGVTGADSNSNFVDFVDLNVPTPGV